LWSGRALKKGVGQGILEIEFLFMNILTLMLYIVKHLFQQKAGHAPFLSQVSKHIQDILLMKPSTFSKTLPGHKKKGIPLVEAEQ